MYTVEKVVTLREEMGRFVVSGITALKYLSFNGQD